VPSVYNCGYQLHSKQVLQVLSDRQPVPGKNLCSWLSAQASLISVTLFPTVFVKIIVRCAAVCGWSLEETKE